MNLAGAVGRAVLGRKGGGKKTYADWQAHANILAMAGELYSDSNGAAFPIGKYTIKNLNMGGSLLFGSPWQAPGSYQGFTRDVGAAVRHCMPSEAMWNSQVGRQVVIELFYGGQWDGLPSYTRNGFTSQAVPYEEGLVIETASINRLWYFVDGVGAFYMNPPLATGPFVYDF